MDNFKSMKISHPKSGSVLRNQLILKYEKGKFKCTVVNRYNLIMYLFRVGLSFIKCQHNSL